MESTADPQESAPTAPPPRLRVRLLGPMAIWRDDVALALPASRKVRALLACLALAPAPVSRSQLCDWLWDVPDDPRGELRWCLSKLRGLIDSPGRPRVVTVGDHVGLDLTDAFVDAREIIRATEAGLQSLSPERLRELCALFEGELLEGSEVERSPVFSAWLTAQRRRLRGCHTALLEQLVTRVADEEAIAPAEQWIALAPFDRRAHASLLGALVRRGRIGEAEDHLAAVVRRFEDEGLDAEPLHEAWRALRAQTGPAGSAAEPVLSTVADDAPSARDAHRRETPHRASIAVMPFADRTGAATASGDGGALAHSLAHSLVHDVITRLAQLRSLFVIAQGSVFALHERGIGPEEAARMLDVDYVVGGSVRRAGARIAVEIELSETRSARIIHAEVFDAAADDTLVVLDEIGNRIVASIASEIEAAERNRAMLRPPSSLDAWEAHHRGLWHMYRFNPADNAEARHFFERAVQLDPTFARAFAGLSFTHFQIAFQGWGDREPASARAFEAAGQSLMADDRDPAAHWAMGRALWLRDRLAPSIAELEQAIELSPNFALGHYALAFVHSQAGDPEAAIAGADRSRELSPFDPMLFAMLGARAMALVRIGRFDEAAEWAAKAAARPNAHPHIVAMAAYCAALAGDGAEARRYAEAVRRAVPGYAVGEFLRAFRFDEEGERRFREAGKGVGM